MEGGDGEAAAIVATAAMMIGAEADLVPVEEGEDAKINLTRKQ
jgi:hypothetical protein